MTAGDVLNVAVNIDATNDKTNTYARRHDVLQQNSLLQWRLPVSDARVAISRKVHFNDDARAFACSSVVATYTSHASCRSDLISERSYSNDILHGRCRSTTVVLGIECGILDAAVRASLSQYITQFVMFVFVMYCSLSSEPRRRASMFDSSSRVHFAKAGNPAASSIINFTAE